MKEFKMLKGEYQTTPSGDIYQDRVTDDALNEEIRNGWEVNYRSADEKMILLQRDMVDVDLELK